MYDLIIIGGGPAGLTAAIYAIRKRLNVLLLSKDLGGKTNYRLALPWIEDYQVIKGLEVVNKFRNELEYLEFARHIESVDKVEKEYTMKGLCYSALSYAPLFIDKSVVVIGDEDLALRSAGELATVAKEV